MEPGHAFGQVFHYIHLDPVRAKVVPPGNAAAYRLGSLSKFVGEEKRPAWLEAGVVLAEAGGLAGTRAGWRSYLRYLEFLATDEPAKRELVSKRMSRGWCLGSGSFKKAQQREAARLAMGRPASASQFVRRTLLTEAGREAVEQLLSRVET